MAIKTTIYYWNQGIGHIGFRIQNVDFNQEYYRSSAHSNFSKDSKSYDKPPISFSLPIVDVNYDDLMMIFEKKIDDGGDEWNFAFISCTRALHNMLQTAGFIFTEIQNLFKRPYIVALEALSAGFNSLDKHYTFVKEYSYQTTKRLDELGKIARDYLQLTIASDLIHNDLKRVPQLEQQLQKLKQFDFTKIHDENFVDNLQKLKQEIEVPKIQEMLQLAIELKLQLPHRQMLFANRRLQHEMLFSNRRLQPEVFGNCKQSPVAAHSP
jgi:hypothetical protein